MTKQEAAAAKARCDTATPFPGWKSTANAYVAIFPDGRIAHRKLSHDMAFDAHCRADMRSALVDRAALVEALMPFVKTLHQGSLERPAQKARLLLLEMGELE